MLKYFIALTQIILGVCFTADLFSAPSLIPYSPDPTVDFTPTLSWNSLSGATNYRVRIDDNSDFTSPLEFTTAVGVTSYKTPELWQGDVYWNVSSDIDAFTEYCPYDHFVISTAPAIIVYNPDPTPDMTPTLLWNSVSGASGYKIQIDDNPAFPTPLSYSVSTATSYSVNLPNENKWYWRVSSNIDSTHFSNCDSFTYQKPQIDRFNGSTVNTNYPNFTWISYPGSYNYKIEVNDDITFTTPIYSGYTSGATSYRSTTWLSAPYTFYWRVSTSHDYTAHSDIDSVRISIRPELVTFGGNTIDVTMPVFKWHPVNGATSYYLHIDTNAAFSTPAESYTTDTFTTMPSELSLGKYYWRVSSSLDLSYFSNPDSIIIIDTIPDYYSPPNTPPVISIPETDSLYEDHPEIIPINVSDADNDTIILSIPDDTPDGLSINQVSHTLSWTPGNDDVGHHILTIIADDNHGGKDTALCSLVVFNTNDFPVIDSILIPDTTFEDSLISGLIFASDPDLNDSLFLQLDSSIQWLKIKKQFINRSSRYFTVEGIPGNSDTGLIKLKVSVSDREGLKTDTSWTIFIVNTNDAPETKLLKKEVMYGAARYTFKGEDDFDSLLTYYIRVRRAAVNFDSLLTNNDGRAVLHPLTDGTYHIDCYSVDSEGLPDPTPVFDTLIISGVTTCTLANSGIWNMVSIPGSDFDAAPLKKGGNILHWDESREPDGLYKYYIRAKNITHMTPGNSYWTKLDTSLRITLNENDLYRKDSIILDLRKDSFGWNQIASPYLHPVRWNSTLTLWEWDPRLRDFIESESVLFPWDGYWVHTETSVGVPIYSKPFFMDKRMSRRTRTYFVDKEEWTFRISLVSNVNRDRDNLFGFSRQAQNGPDELDRPEPPRMGNEPFIFFPHAEWERTIQEFASDIRHKWNNKNIFQVGISPCSKNITELAMTISGYASDIPIYLFVNTTKGVVQYLPKKVLTITPSNEKQYRTIFVTEDRNFLKNFPFKFALNHPYPNPCHPMTTIHYTLPYRWQKNGWLNEKPYVVSIRIYDTRGRVIKDLVNRKQIPDRYSVVWRGKSNTNRIVAPGFYFIRLVAGKYLSARKIIVFK